VRRRRCAFDGAVPTPTDLAQLDARIAQLRGEFVRAQRALALAETALRDALRQRTELVAQLAPPAPTTPPAAPTTLAPGPETSTRTVQNVLFVLGGVLLGTAAIAFTLVAWTTYGVIARATILATVTLLALGVPGLALARRLRATAETFAGIGLLLVVLDGYAIWYANLFHARSMEGARYAGIVAGITALVALGYRRLTRLSVPLFAALVAAQPVAMLVAVPARPGLAQTSLLATAVAVLDALAVAGVSRARLSPGIASGMRAVAWTGFAMWATAGAATALAAQATTVTVPARALAGAATVGVTLGLLLAAWIAGPHRPRAAAAGAVVAALTLSLFLTGALVWAHHTGLVLAATVLAVGVSARLVEPALPGYLRSAPRWAALGAAGLGVLVLGMTSLPAVAATIRAAYPFWSASLSPGHRTALLVSDSPVGLLGLALAALVAGPRWTKAPVSVAGGVLAMLALPAAVPIVWWAPPALDLAGVAVLLAVYLFVRRRGAGFASVRASIVSGAAVLLADALLTGTARPEQTAFVLTGIFVLGLAVGLLARGGVLGGAGLAIGLLSAPPALGSALRALQVQPYWALRATVGAAALLVVLAAGRWRTSTVDVKSGGVFVAAVVSAGFWPLLATVTGEEPVGVYCGVTLVLIAGALLALPSVRGWPVSAVAASAVPAAVAFAIAELPVVLAVSVYPYAWLGSVWSGRPAGVGVTPDGFVPAVHALDAVALVLLATTGAVGAYAVRRNVRAALAGLSLGGPSAVLAVVVAAGAPWPALPAATLVLGLVIVVSVGLGGSGALRAMILCGQSFVYIGAGVAGALSLPWSTLAALGLVVVAFSVVAALGRTAAWRVAGCLVAVAAAVGDTTAAGISADLHLHAVSFIVLGVAAAALAVGAYLRRRSAHRVEALAIEAAANGAALVGLTLTAGHAGWTAGVLAVWGVVLGARAVAPGITRGVRTGYAAAAGGLEVVAWWVLLTIRGETLVEAYTLPLAGVALLAGWAALRSRPELRSWIAYGPALLAGFLPTLATIVTTEGDWRRRLALGAAGLVSVVAGAVRRRRAPVVVGGIVLVTVALHELLLLWQRVQGWIPLAAGGAILLFLAITYERRLRDVARVRSALHRMS
jgi:hypothetical protein